METRFTLNRRIFRRVPARKRGLIAVVAAAVAAGASLGLGGCGGAAAAAPLAPGAQADQVPGEATGLGPLSGLLPRDHLTLESAIQVDLSTETVRLPLYPGIAYAGTPHQEKVWYILMDASDAGAAHDLGINYAPKLANIDISCPACVQTVTLTNPTPQANPFGPAVINFAGAPDFSPTRIAVPGPDGFPLRRSPRGSTSGRSTRTSCSTWPPPSPTCSPGSTRPPASPSPTARTGSTSTAR